MKFYDKGLIKAMKEAYKNGGYDVAVTEKSMIIQGKSWGVEIRAGEVPNSIKSLIVLHNGSLPKAGCAIRVSKAECTSMIFESVISTMESLAEVFARDRGRPVFPTRLEMDGCRVWQTADNLQVRLVDPDEQQILSGAAWLIGNVIYTRDWFGDMFIHTLSVSKADKAVLEHLAQMQWIPLDAE